VPRSDPATTVRQVSHRAALDAWVSLVARIAGLILLLGFGVVWIVTALRGNPQSDPILVGAGLTLYGVGVLGRARALLDKIQIDGGEGDGRQPKP
jgi:hypothetical protein